MLSSFHRIGHVFLTGISVVTYKLKNGEKLPIVTHPGNIGTKDSLVNIWKVFENKNNF